MSTAQAIPLLIAIAAAIGSLYGIYGVQLFFRQRRIVFRPGRELGANPGDFGQAYDYLKEKGQAIKAADPEQSYKTGLAQFVDQKSYKPVFEPFKLGTMLTDQRK